MQEQELLDFLEKKVIHSIRKFPRLLDNSLLKGFQRLVANSPKDFLISRSVKHLQKLLLTQFFIQKKIEASLQREAIQQQPIFLKLFQCSSRICIALCSIDRSRFRHDQVLKTIQILLPGVQEIQHSFYLWLNPELPYFFCYLEVQKLRGGDLSTKDLKKLQKALQDQLQITSPLTPALFWPYNEEESFRQVQHLVKEIESQYDIPQVSIQFQEQTSSSLEFLIHIARHQSSEKLSHSFELLPSHLDCFCHFQYIVKTRFPIELGAFTLKIPSHAFDVRESINLLYARRYVMKLLEPILGPCRDYNGGLFIKQQEHFETVRACLSDKIPLFDLFAEKVFYALRPVETRLMLSMKDAEELFSAFSQVMLEKGLHAKKYDNVMIIKAANSADLPRLTHINKENKGLAFAQLCCGEFHYHCVLDTRTGNSKTFMQNDFRQKETTKILRLIFEEGAPPSLNPHHSSGDMRSHLIGKLLFEGLMRLNAKGEPELAGAAEYESDPEGTIHHFKLRHNRWSNGERVTAFDYAVSLQHALRDHMSHPEIYFVIKNAQNFREKRVPTNQVGIRALNIDTLEIELDYPDRHFLHQLARPLFFPLFGSLKEPKWFNGPYLVHQHNNELIHLKRNPYFWNTKSQFFEEIEIRWDNDIQTIYNLFKQGKVDWIGDPLSTIPSPYIQSLEKEAKLHHHEVIKHFLVCFKTKHPVLSSALIRRALSLAIDRSLICNTIYPYSLPYSSLTPCKEEANALFEQGLKELNLTRGTFPLLTFSYSHQERREKLAECLQTVWQQILGITVHLEKIEWNLFRNRLEKKQFEICGTIQENINKDFPRNLEKFEGQSSWNFTGWQHPQYRSLVEKIKSEPNEERRQILFERATQIIEEEAPFTPLFKYTHLFSHSHQLEGYLLDERGCVDFSNAKLIPPS